VQLQQQ